MSNSANDVLPERSWAYLASNILAKLPDAGKPYVEALKAPGGWWTGLDELVKTITVYTAEMECLRDDDISMAWILKEHHKNVTLFVHQRSVHTDPYLTRLAGEKESEEIIKLVLGHFRA
jgi:acetyl esterase/lipase